MYKLVIVFVFGISLFSCKSDVKSDKVEEQSLELSEPSTTIDKIEACEYLDVNDLNSIMQWDPALTMKDQLFTLDKKGITVCNYYQGKEMLMVRVSWKNQNAIDKKILKQNFESYLSLKDQLVSYEFIASDKYTQTLYGVGKDIDGNNVNILRKRYGNICDVHLEISSGDELQSNNKEKFLGIVDLIENHK